MLGLILIYFIGRSFYRLAEQFNKNRWLFAILGIVAYYAGTFIGGLILGIVDGFLGLGFNWDNDLSLGLIALPFGVLMTYVFYVLLKRNWKKLDVETVDMIQDIGKSIDH